MKLRTLLDNLLATLFIYFFLFGLSKIPVGNTDLFNPLSDMFSDFELSDIAFSQYRELQEADTNMVIVNFGDLNRGQLAELINVINEYEPSCIGIDAFYRNPKDSAMDAALADAFSKTKKLVLVSELLNFDREKMSHDSLKVSNPMFSQYAIPGFANMITSIGSKGSNEFRVVRVFGTQSENTKTKKIDYSFAYTLAKIYNPESIKNYEKWRKTQEEKGPYIVNFRGNIYGESFRFSTLDVEDVFNRNFVPELIKNKIVLLGFMGHSLDTKAEIYGEDKFFTPLNNKYVGKAYPDMYGLVVHANILSNILYGNFISNHPFMFNLLYGFLLVFLSVCLFHYIKRKYDLFFDIATIFIQLIFIVLINYVVEIFIFNKYNVKIDLSIGMVCLALSAQLMEVYLGISSVVYVKVFKKKLDRKVTSY